MVAKAGITLFFQPCLIFKVFRTRLLVAVESTLPTLISTSSLASPGRPEPRSQQSRRFGSKFNRAKMSKVTNIFDTLDKSLHESVPVGRSRRVSEVQVLQPAALYAMMERH